MAVHKFDHAVFSLHLNEIGLCKKNCTFLMFFTLLCVLSAIPAHAGTYTLTSIATQLTCSIPALNTNTVNNSPTSSQITTPWIGGNGQTPYASGTYTYTFTWNAAYVGEPAPKTAIAKEVASAQWDSYNSSVFNTSANDGLGDDEIDSQLIVNNEPVDFFEGISSGTHYVQIPPNNDGSVTVTISPSATGLTAVQLSVNVPSVTPVELDFSGTTLDTSGNQNILIGQQLTASISLPDGATASNCFWSSSNGNPKAGYASNGSMATPWQPLEIAGSTFCYFTSGGAPGSSIQSNFCCIGHINLPSGALPAGGLDVEADKNINIYTPDYTLTPTTGVVTWTPSASAKSGNICLGGLTCAKNGAPCGLDWSQTYVYTPNLLNQSKTAWGSWCMYQFDTCTLSQIYKPSFSSETSVEYDIAGTAVSQPNTLINVNDKFAVDCELPYCGHTYDANGNPDGNADKPGDGVPQTTVNNSVSLKETSTSCSHSFTDYLMYEPPSNGAGTIWVPLAKFTWAFSYSLTADSLGIWTETKKSDPTQPSAEATSDYPTWSYVMGDANLDVKVIDSNGDTAD